MLQFYNLGTVREQENKHKKRLEKVWERWRLLQETLLKTDLKTTLKLRKRGKSSEMGKSSKTLLRIFDDFKVSKAEISYIIKP